MIIIKYLNVSKTKDCPIHPLPKEERSSRTLDKMVMNNTCEIVNRSRSCDKCNTIKDENNFMIKGVICNKCLIQEIKENNEEKIK